MAQIQCAWCSAMDTMPAFSLVQCLVCGLHTDFNGNRAVPDSQVTEGITVADIPEPTPYPSRQEATDGEVDSSPAQEDPVELVRAPLEGEDPVGEGDPGLVPDREP